MFEHNKYFNPLGEVDRHRHNLPHWQQVSVGCFVTWRLADSLPECKLTQWNEEKEIWLRLHPEPWDTAMKKEYVERFDKKINQWLDAGEGSCVLQNPAIAKIVASSLFHFNTQKYNIDAFVVMPNHVHLLFSLMHPYQLGETIRTLKGYTARMINKQLGKSGSLWQNDYWDRLVRNQVHHEKCIEYIRGNPEKAFLKHDDYILYVR